MLVVGSMAVIRWAERHGTTRPWLLKLLGRRTTKIAAVALANKTARIAWAIMTTGERWREPKIAAFISRNRTGARARPRARKGHSGR